MQASVEALFARYESIFNRALAGAADMEEVASLYSSAFIAASPLGVMTGQNDDQLQSSMAEGYAHYRDIGTKGMRIRDISIAPIDERHCLAHVGWSASYAKPGQPDIVIDFAVHYLVQLLDGEARVFGWVSGDEQALLKERGVI